MARLVCSERARRAAPNGPRFDRSFMSLSAAADGLGVALESTLLAEREIASGRLVRPLQGSSEDVVYTGHWLVFPRSKRFARSMVMFLSWLTKQLGLDINLATSMRSPPVRCRRLFCGPRGPWSIGEFKSLIRREFLVCR